MATKDQVFINFAKQTGTHTKGSKCGSLRGVGDGRVCYNMFYEGRILYSFGTHFPLAIRHQDARVEGAEGFGCGVGYIINGDKYSVSTSSHQGGAISMLQKNVQIPFSALESAWNWKLQQNVYYKEWGQWHTLEEAQADAAATGKSVWDAWGYTTNPEWVNRPNALAQLLRDGKGGFRIVAFQKDTWEYRFCPAKDGVEWTCWYDSKEVPEEYQILQYSGDPKEMQGRHRLGAVLFRIREHTFLSSFDQLDRSNYFLCHVPGEPTSVEEAYENLVPEAVKALPSREGVLRQGDWFFIPASPDKDVQRLIRSWSKSQESNHRLGGSGGTHVVTRMRSVPRATIADEAAGRMQQPLEFVQGCVRHDPPSRRPEHKRLKLGDGKTWYVPVKNTSEAGWGARGNVD